YSLTQNPLGFSINSATGLITGTAPSVNSNTNYNIEISVSDGISTFIQAYVLTVDNVGSHSGGGNGGIREIDSSQPTTIKKSIGYVPTTTTKKTTSTNASTLIIFYVIILFVTLGIFFVTFLLIQNLRNREVETGKKSKFSETYY
ncbi:MAG: putative Ig domain-containing protein, partial [Nanoarchaeota archaeon]|nr:putative Ig domain-containing protein [Nanoarchaeota archaeon]